MHCGRPTHTQFQILTILHAAHFSRKFSRKTDFSGKDLAGWDIQPIAPGMPDPSSNSAGSGFSLSGPTLDPSEFTAVGRALDATVDLDGSVPPAANQGTSDQPSLLEADASVPSDQTAYLLNPGGDSGPVDQSGRTGELPEVGDGRKETNPPGIGDQLLQPGRGETGLGQGDEALPQLG
jgi:hypothetical protein